MTPSEVDTAMQRYAACVVEHPHLTETLDAICRCLSPGMPPRILLLLGATGVGKTTLLSKLSKRLPSRGGSDRRPQRAVFMSCLAPTNRGYEFTGPHWTELACAAGDPYYQDHQCPDRRAEQLRVHGGDRYRLRSVEEKRRGVLAMLRRSGVGVVVLDEAQHLTRVRGARTQVEQLDVIKDCVDRSGATHMLVGTYELSVMVVPNDQLARRTQVVEFKRYDASLTVDVDAFHIVFGQLVQNLPFDDPDPTWKALEPELTKLMIGCVGCVGVLKEWLLRALRFALESGAQAIDWPMMEREMLELRVLYSMAMGIRTFRDAQERLGLDDVARCLEAPALTTGSGAKRANRKSSRKGGHTPGRRNPVRDPVGVQGASLGQ